MTTKHRGHERNSLHRGDLPATLVELADAIAPYPAGTSVEDVLRALWDEVTFWETNNRQFGGLSADAILFKTQHKTFTMDAYYKWRDFVADAVLQRTMVGSTAMDAWVGGPRMYGSFPLDSFIFASTGGTFTADAIKRAFGSGSFTMDSRYVYHTLASFVADAVLFGTVSRTFPVNAITKKTLDGSLLLDSILSQTFGGTLDLDAILKRTQGGSALLDSILFKSQAGSFPADAILSFNQSGSALMDAIVLRVQAATILLDAVIQTGLTTIYGDFKLDALLQLIASGSVTADAIVKKVIATTFNLDGVVKGPISGTFTLDANIPRFFRIDSKVLKDVIYRPTSDVSKSSTTYSTGTAAWSLVDEASLDTSDWFENVTVNGWTMMGITPGTHPSSDIKRVKIQWSGRNSAPAFAFSLGFRNGSTNYPSSADSVTIAQNATSGSWTRSVRPWDNAAWTTTDIDNLAFGQIAPSSLAKCRAYQMYVTVSYY